MSTLLRVQEGTPGIEELDIIFKEYELEFFTPEPNFLESFKKRAASLGEAFQFLLQAYPPKVREFLLPFAKIEDYLHQHAVNFADKKTFAAQQEELVRYVKSLVDLTGALYGEKVNSLLNDAECYLLMKKGRKNIITIAWHPELDAYLVQEEEALPAYDAYLLDDLQIIKRQLDKEELVPENWPLWFRALAVHKQHFIFYLLKELSSIQGIEKISFFISSRNRDLPVLSNWARHRVRLINKKREVLFESNWKYRSSHIVPRDMVSEASLPHEVRESVLQRHIHANMQHVVSATMTSKLLIHTLISPLSILRNFSPDYYLNQYLYENLHLMKLKKGDLDLFFLNQPLNLWRVILYTQENEITKEIERIGQVLGDTLVAEKKLEIESLLERFRAVLQSYFGGATFNDPHGRELILASYMELILTRVGYVSYGSCVSGKDRKAIEIIHTDALELFKVKFKHWPNFDNQVERNYFTDLFSWLYKTRHHAVHAGQNAPGSEGIKTPSMYLSADITHKIGFCEEDDRIASNNEVKAIYKSDKKASQALSRSWMLSFCTSRFQEFGEDHFKALDLRFKRLVSRGDVFPRTSSFMLFSQMPFSDFVTMVKNDSQPLLMRLTEIFNYGLKYYHFESSNEEITALQLKMFKSMHQFLRSHIKVEKLLEDLDSLGQEGTHLLEDSVSCTF